MQTNQPINLCDAKSWWTVYATGLQRGSIKTTASSFVYFEEASHWAEKKRRKGLSVEVKEEFEVLF